MKSKSKTLRRRDKMTPQQRSYCMSRVKSKHTSLEILFATELKRRELKYENYAVELPGKPDFVFRQAKLAVFVDGDFWHGWQYERWKNKLSPYWFEKISGNRKRDQANFRRLRIMGWKVIRLWEHSIKHDLRGSLEKVERALGDIGSSAT